MIQSAAARVASSGNLRQLTTEPEWSKAHVALSKLARERASLDGREAVWLLRAYRARAHWHLGHGSFTEYVERTLGFGPRMTYDRLRTAEVLEHLPQIRQVLNDGDIHWTAVRELARVATAETEAEWLAATRERTVREIEQMVSGRTRGDRPGDAPKPEAMRHVLRFEVNADTLATFREAVKRLRQDSDEHLDDDDVLLLMARQVLRAPSADEGEKSSYQIALTVCAECRRGAQRAGADELDVEPVIVDMAGCDAQHIGSVDDGQTNSTHVGQRETARAKQTVPPARRRRVMRRDRGCCVVPGCRNSTFVDVHHIDWRVDGGQHDIGNLVVLCGAHHRAVHRGLLRIARDSDGALTFQRSRGPAPEHDPPNPIRRAQ
jgi:HNH endonuclease